MIVCDVIIPIWNQRERTQRCLESVLRNTALPIRLILIDNGSEPETRDWLETFTSQKPLPVELLRNAENLGFIQAVNQGIRSSKNPWVCLLNNDTIVTSGWLAEMIRVAEANPLVGLVNPTSNSLGFQPRGLTPSGPLGVRPLQVLEAYASSLKADSGRWSELTTALGFCLLARRKLFDQIGLLDEGYGMGNFDDDDLSRRVRQTGLLCVRAAGAYVFHEEKVSFRKLPDWKKDFDENRRRFHEKWGRSLRILWERMTVPYEVPGLILAPSSDLSAAIQLAREGHWVYLLTPVTELPRAVSSQAQISRKPLKARHWRLPALWRVLAKRKKPFDLVVTNDPRWARWLKRLHRFHRAKVLENRSTEEILSECRNLSRSL